MIKKLVAVVLSAVFLMTHFTYASAAAEGPTVLPAKIAAAAYSNQSGVTLNANTDSEQTDAQMVSALSGGWLEFQISVPRDRLGYTFAARVHSGGDKPSMRVSVDGKEQFLLSEGAPSGEGVAWFTTTAQSVDLLTAGTHTLRLEWVSSFDLSWIQIDREVRRVEEGVTTVETYEYNRASKTFNEFEDSKDPDGVIQKMPKGQYAGDWFEFDLCITEEMAGLYDLTAHAARGGTSSMAAQFLLDGKEIGAFEQPCTGGWTKWTAVGPYQLMLSAGNHVIRIKIVHQCNISLFKLERVAQTGETIRIDAVNYTAASSGIGKENCSDPEVAGGQNPKSTSKGAWMEWNLNLTEESAGNYWFTTHVARSGTAANDIQYVCYLDGQMISEFACAGTGGWQSWRSSDPVGLRLSAGNHVIRIEWRSQFNMSLLKFERMQINADAEIRQVAIVGEEPFTATKGKTTLFFAQATGEANCNPFVSWELLTETTRSKIDENGVLNVSFGETCSTLALRARAAGNPSIVSDTVTVRLIDESDDHSLLSREVAQEGMVLLKNEGGVLPLKHREHVVLLGLGQVSYVKGGSGSGDVTSAFERTIPDGLRDMALNGRITLDEDLMEFYRQYYYSNNGSIGLREPDISLITPYLDTAAEQENAVAVVVLSRRWGEGSDVDTWDSNGANAYQIGSHEKTLIQAALDRFEKVVLVLNTGGVMDLSWAVSASAAGNPDKKIDSILLAWQPGMEGGIAVAEALCGDINPSGKLTDTFVTSFNDYPSSGSYGNNDYTPYEEDIFVGYRYFETFAPDKVIYPFGFGLSYTSFEISERSAAVNKATGKIDVQATVTNAGSCSGKEVVQVYFSAPAGKLPKPKMELAAFQKTGLLAPGESQTVTMSFNIADMASYDDIGKTGKESAYVLEAGTYRILVGNSVRNCQEAGSYQVGSLTVTEQLTKRFQPSNPSQSLTRRLDGSGADSYETTVWSETAAGDTSAKTVSGAASAVTEGADTVPSDAIITLSDVAEDPSLMSAFLAQLTEEELVLLASGSSTSDHREILDGGITATTMDILKYGIPRLQTSDGPAGIRNYKYTSTAWPCATLQACTWNPGLVEQAGAALAQEAKELKVLEQYLGESLNHNGSPIVLTPSTNIHRDPKCGRNFEYYSEDPYISGIMAGAQIGGIQSEGVSATLKHFSANNRETNRKNNDSRVSERAMREIYLKPFQIAISLSNPWCVMSSYNKINGTWASMNSELLTGVLRDEWEYKGMVMTDWGSEAALLDEIKAGSALKMPGASKEQSDAVLLALQDGTLSRNQLERVVRDMMYMELHTYLFHNDKALLDAYNPVDIALPSGATGRVDYKFYYKNEPVRFYAEGLDETAYALRVTDESGRALPLVRLDDGGYTFVMPDSRVTVSLTERRIGDVNLDGKVDLLDLIRIKRLLSNNKFDEMADLDGSGTLNGADLILLRRNLLGYVPEPTMRSYTAYRG